MAIRPIDQQTLASISGQKTAEAVQGFQKSMQNMYSVYSDMESRNMKKELHTKEMEVADLNIEVKKQKGVGSAAIGLLQLAETSNDMTFQEQYNTYRDNAPKGVKEGLPEGFESSAHAKQWATQQAAQADRLIPWLKLKADKASAEQWEVTAGILAKDPKTLTDAENRYLEFFKKADTNIFVGNPSNAKLENTVMSLANTKAPGSDSVMIDVMDANSRAAYLTAVSNSADLIVAQSAKTSNPIDRTTAIDMSVEALKSRVVATETLLTQLPWVGDMFDKELVFINPETEAMLDAEDEKRSSGTDANNPNIKISNGYKWDTSVTPYKNLGKVE